MTEVVQLRCCPVNTVARFHLPSRHGPPSSCTRLLPPGFSAAEKETNTGSEFFNESRRLTREVKRCERCATSDGEGGLHASMDVVRHVTMQQPRSRSARHHFHRLENPGEEVQDVGAVHPVRLHRHKEPEQIREHETFRYFGSSERFEPPLGVRGGFFLPFTKQATSPHP